MQQIKPFLKIFIVSIFGWTGIQKFIEKKYAIGVLFLLSLGLFCVGWVFDICKAYYSTQKKVQ